MAILKVANIHFDAVGTTVIRANGANVLTFNTAGAEDMRIDANGRVGIGTTTPNTKLMVYGTTGSTADFRITGQNINSFMSSYAIGDGDWVPSMELLKTNGTDTARSNVRVGASLGRINWYGARGNTGDALVYLTGQVEVITTSEASGGATPGGAMLFKTAAANSGLGSVEVARIDASGNVLIGRTNSTLGQGVKLDVAGGINASAVLVNGAPALTGGITSNVVISVADNTNAALRITQTGTGEAIRVEDNANPDSTPFVVDANGNVGIGTSSPASKLEVVGFIREVANFGDIRMITTDNRGWRIGTTSNATTLGSFYIQGSTDNFTSSFINSLYVIDTGNVGIGTSSPTQRLDVNGAINASAVLVNGAPALTGGITSNVVISVADNNNAALRITQTGTGEAFRVEDSANPDASPFVIDANGNVGIGTSSPFNLTTSFASSKDPVIINDGSYFGGGTYYDGNWRNTVNNQGGWVFRNTSGNFTIWTGSTGGNSGNTMVSMAERVRIDSIGNVLIGRTDSTVGAGVKLDVNGAINASAVLVNGASILATSNTYTQTVGAAANGWANTISDTRALASNAYSVTVGTAGNVYAREVGTAGNAYTVTVGTAGNVYAREVGTAGNVYAREVGTAGNSYTQTVGAAANGWANTISDTRALASNAYAVTVGTAGNAYAQAVGTAGNAYTVTVGTAGNAYAQAVGTAGNSYTVTVGAAANGWSNTKLSNTSGISFNGNLTVPGEFTVGGNLIFDTATATRIWEPAVNTLAIITTQTERMRVDSSGNVLIGRTDSTVGLGVKLDVNGTINTAALYVNGAPITGGATILDDTVNATRYVTFVDALSGTMTKANVDSTLTFNPSTGTLSSTIFNSTSDEILKYDVRPIENALAYLDEFNGVHFKWKKTNEPSLGVIAQEVEKVLPELIGTDGNYKTVNYNGIIAVLIQAVKELKAEIEVLKNR